MNIKRIPCLYAGHIPNNIRIEMESNPESYWGELCWHGDGGCVFTIGSEDIKSCPLFIYWLIANDVFTEEEINKLKNGEIQYLKIAMTGT